MDMNETSQKTKTKHIKLTTLEGIFVEVVHFNCRPSTFSRFCEKQFIIKTVSSVRLTCDIWINFINEMNYLWRILFVSIWAQIKLKFFHIGLNLIFLFSDQSTLNCFWVLTATYSNVCYSTWMPFQAENAKKAKMSNCVCDSIAITGSRWTIHCT